MSGLHRLIQCTAILKLENSTHTHPRKSVLLTSNYVLENLECLGLPPEVG